MQKKQNKTKKLSLFLNPFRHNENNLSDNIDNCFGFSQLQPAEWKRDLSNASQSYKEIWFGKLH